MIFAVKLKRCIANADILNIIISEFCYRKKLCLINLFKIDKNLKITFYCTVLPLNLAIYLRIKGS